MPRCRAVSFAFDWRVSHGPYEGLLREIILRMKQWSGEDLAEVIGTIWANEWPSASRRYKPIRDSRSLHWWRLGGAGSIRRHPRALPAVNSISLLGAPFAPHSGNGATNATAECDGSPRERQARIPRQAVKTLRGKTVLLRR